MGEIFLYYQKEQEYCRKLALEQKNILEGNLLMLFIKLKEVLLNY